MKRKTLSVLIFVFVVLTTTCSWATTRGVPIPYPTIQEAIDAAETGDTVLVAPGTYTGPGNKNIEFTLNVITVMSEAGASTTVIDCLNEGRGFRIVGGSGTGSIIDGFTITNGNEGDGGGIYCYSSYPIIRNCILDGNNTASSGGGIFCFGTSDTNTVEIDDCIFKNNHSNSGAGIYCTHASPEITNCFIEGNSVNLWGGGIHCHTSSPTITNCEILGNAASERGGGIYCDGNSLPRITDCTISGNSTLDDGGGISCSGNSNPNISSCFIAQNIALDNGGAIWCYNSDPEITNCMIFENTADNVGGGAFLNSNSDPKITHCTITDNSAGVNGGGICCDYGSSPIIKNCILWNDSPQEFYIISGDPDVTYSDVQGGWPGEGNIDSDPLFVDPGSDDYHLQRGSPCIDAGIDAGVYIDIDGDVRPWGEGFDMGADECAENIPPDPFSLLSPADGETIAETPLWFDWEDAPDGDGDEVLYDFYLDTDSGFTNPVLIDSLTESEYFHTPELINFEQYYWKVKAYDGYGGETWSSEVFTFLVGYAEAIIDIAPGSFHFELFIDDVDLDTLLICNTGNIPLDFNISWIEDWVTVEPSESSIPPDSCMAVEVVCSAAELLPGVYSDTLVISSNAEQDPVLLVPVSLEVETPVITILECDYPIAPRGGYLYYRAGLANVSDKTRTVDVWLDLYLLNGDPYPGNPFAGPITITMRGLHEAIQDRQIYVPYYAELGGPYELCLRCGQYPFIWDESCFEFTVTPSTE